MALGQDPGEKWNKSQIKGQNKTAFPLFCRKLFIIMQNAFLFTPDIYVSSVAFLFPFSLKRSLNPLEKPL
ncbi:hypothetical protein [Angelakisella massiliensis]|uniref:hypothetical protein n=1 Tax=Angelakisella massiliensis TaxID=1871018 RepID=UPI0008F853FB|nr:hypothetical protein [Angelakisella massiliensis]